MSFCIELEFVIPLGFLSNHFVGHDTLQMEYGIEGISVKPVQSEQDLKRAPIGSSQGIVSPNIRNLIEDS